jgi:hypothetical protein
MCERVETADRISVRFAQESLSGMGKNMQLAQEKQGKNAFVFGQETDGEYMRRCIIFFDFG